MVDKLSARLDKAVDKMERMTGKTADAKKQMQELDKSGLSLQKTVARLASAFTMKELVSKIATVRGEFQQLEVAFKTMLGNAEKADALMQQLTRTAATTPFGLEDVAQGAKQLLAYGFEAEKVNETLIRLGDIAAGLSVPLNDLVYLYGTTMAQGRLYTQDLNQFTGRGIPMISELAKQFGVAESKVKELVEAGKVGFPEVQKVIESLTDEGGKFGGLMDAQSKTITGQISNIEDAISMMFNELGQQSEGVINATLSKISYVIEHYERFGRILLGLVGTYGVYKTAVMTVVAAKGWATAAEALHYNWLLLVEKAQKMLNATMLANPYVLVATLIAGVVAVMVSMKTETERLQEAEEAYEAQKQKVIETEEEHRRKMEELCSIAGDEAVSTDTRREALNKLEQKYPDIFAKYDTEYEKLKNIKKIKEEIVLLDGQQSITNPKNELKRVEERIRELEAKKATERAVTYNSEAGSTTTTIGGLSQTEKEELQNLLNKRKTLSGQIRKSEVNAYFENLTGVSNETLAQQIKQRETLLAQMTMQEKKYGRITQGGAALAGTYSRDELQYQLNKLRSEQNRRKEQTDSSSDWVASAKKKYQDALKTYNAFIKNTSNKLTKEEFEKKAKELKDAVDTAKKEYDKVKPGTDSDADKEKEKREKANAKTAEQEEKGRQAEAAKRKQEASEKQTAFDLKQAEIDGLQEGFEKELETINLNYDKLIEANRLRRQEWIDELQTISDLSFEQAHPDWKKQGLKRPTVSYDDLSADQKNYLTQYEAAAVKYKQDSEAKLYKDLLEKYQDYEEQRKSIREKFAADRADIENGKSADKDAKERALAELAKQEEAALKAVDEAQLSELSEENKALVDMFADTSAKSVAEIQKIIDRIKLLMDYLRAAKDENGTAVIKDGKGNTTKTITQKDVAALGFSPEELKVLESSPEKLKALTDQYDKLKKEVLSKNPFKALADSVADFFEKGEDGDEKTLEAKLKNLGESASAAADMVGDIAGKLSEMFEAAGNDSMAQAMADVQDVMSSVSNIGKGFSQGGVVGGIAAAAGEAIGWVTKAFAASARHKAALEKIMQEVTAQQREYNLLLKEQNLEYEKAQTIFGTDTYGKAANAVKVMKESFADLKAEMEGTAAQQKKFEKKNTYNSNYSALKDAYSGLADIEIKTGHKKTGLFGWGKGKDIYSSILDVYPELIDSAGNLNRELAESILNSRQFADNDKEALQYIIDLYDQAEEAWQEVKDWFEGIFGELGQSLTDALVDAFKNGTDAADAFADTVSEMLENLAEQMIYTVTLAPYLEKAQEEMLDVMKNENLTDEEKFSQYVNILDALTDNVLNQQGKANALMEEYKQKAKEKGFDLWTDDSSSQSAKSGGFSAMTQDQGTKLEGMFTSGLQHWSSMDERLETVADRMNLAESHLARIAENTGTSAGHLGEIKEDIRKIVRDGLKVK